jgi:hypothetical protein
VGAPQDEDRSAGLRALEDIDVAVVHRTPDFRKIFAEFLDLGDAGAENDGFGPVADLIKFDSGKNGQDRAQDEDDYFSEHAGPLISTGEDAGERGSGR